MWGLIIALGMNFGWGYHPTYSNYYYWANYNQIYCEDIPGSSDCEHRDHYDWISFCNGYVCTDDHSEEIIPEDCTIASIEVGACRYGVLSDS